MDTAWIVIKVLLMKNEQFPHAGKIACLAIATDIEFMYERHNKESNS